MTNLSVNINKVATLRNARGENVPDVVRFAVECEKLGANGITVHPRPDERHIRRSDVIQLRPVVKTEFNIEGYPSNEFIKLVLTVKPEQVTLVPDAPDALTSSSGWDVGSHMDMLTEIVEKFRDAGIRTSIFVAPDPEVIRLAAKTGADPFVEASRAAHGCGLGVNAGHDLNLENLAFFHEKVPYLNEVSIGHALISDALYLGLPATIAAYRECLRPIATTE